MINDLIGNLGTIFNGVAALFKNVIGNASEVIGELSSAVV